MIKTTFSALLCAAFSLHAQAAGCPGGAAWCDDMENGAGRWQADGGAAQVRIDPGAANQLLQARDGQLLLAANTAALTQAAYFVEARLRPSASAGSKAYLLARYVDARNWIGASAGFTPGSKRVAVELVAMQDGKLVRLKQVSREAEGGNRFHTLRLELGGDLLSVYLNGERLTIAPAAFQPGGHAGVMAEGGAFDIDDVRIGAARLPPARIALARMTARLNLQAGDAAQRFPVSALDGDGITALPFSASSSDPAVASVAVRHGALMVSAHRPGAAIITLASRADVNVATAVAVTVGPAFAAPALTYTLQGRLAPAARAVSAAVDAPLQITFDGPPTLGAAGSVRIFRARDNALVDVIRIGEEVDTIGYREQSFKRAVRYQPFRIDGAHVTIRPHNSRLAYGTEYYVAIDDGVFAGATFGGRPFAGLGRQAGWSFRTRAAPPAGRTLSVDDDGPADFRTVQGAFNHAMRLPRATPVTIRVANGRYEELLYLRGKDRVTLRGESRDGVVIHATNNDSLNPGSGIGQAAFAPSANGGRSLMLIEDADLVTLDTLTLVNTTTRAASTGGSQAETVYFNSDTGRLVATNATFLSEQDTIQVKGYSWFYRTLIAGNVDFIWGANRAALFEDSEIRTVGDSASRDSGGYVVQARTVAAGEPGFVFLNSRLTHGAGPAGNDVPQGATYLARSPGTANTWDNVSYINCAMDRHVAPAGWAGAGVLRQPAPNPSPPGAMAGWSEYGSTDLAATPLDLSLRAGGHHRAQPRFGGRNDVFKGFDGGKGWRPVP
jgi:pectin methylesterase-like acyl-CoA thioesterase